MERKLVKILGFGVDSFSFEEALDYAKQLLDKRIGGHIVTINPEMIEIALGEMRFAKNLKRADLVVPDGIGIKIALKLRGANVERIAGIEFSHKLIEYCSKKGYSIAMVGAKERVVQTAAQNLKKEFPNLNIVCIKNGYFDNVDDIYWALGEKKPRFILVALGAPKQEYFIEEYRKYHKDTLMVGVGGSFDVWAGMVKRAPVIYQKLGIEWLYRAIKEPKRFKRIFPTLPKFIFRVIFYKPRG